MAKRQSPFLGENDPDNPYGNNYIEHPYRTKLFYQYSTIRQHVHIDPADAAMTTRQAWEMAAGVFGGTALGLMSAYGYRRVAEVKPIKNQFPNFKYNHIVMAFMTALSATLSYTHFSERYIDNVCSPIIARYRDEAVSHGYQDYQISQNPNRSYWDRILS